MTQMSKYKKKSNNPNHSFLFNILKHFSESDFYIMIARSPVKTRAQRRAELEEQLKQRERELEEEVTALEESKAKLANLSDENMEQTQATGSRVVMPPTYPIGFDGDIDDEYFLRSNGTPLAASPIGRVSLSRTSTPITPKRVSFSSDVSNSGAKSASRSKGPMTPERRREIAEAAQDGRLLKKAALRDLRVQHVSDGGKAYMVPKKFAGVVAAESAFEDIITRLNADDRKQLGYAPEKRMGVYNRYKTNGPRNYKDPLKAPQFRVNSGYLAGGGVQAISDVIEHHFAGFGRMNAVPIPEQPLDGDSRKMTSGVIEYKDPTQYPMVRKIKYIHAFYK